MKFPKYFFIECAIVLPFSVFAQDDVQAVSHDEIVVTGTRYQTDIRHLPYTVDVLTEQKIRKANQSSLLSIATEEVPGLFATSRGIMGYGVSTGGSGAITMRGINSSTGQLLVLIDGHPQYQGIFSHPIGDSYQSMIADRVEVLKGPASTIYGSNAMGGVINIVTKKMLEDGVATSANIGYGSYNTLQTELTNRFRKGKFNSIVSGSYNRTDGHRPNMEFEQYGGLVKLGYDISDHWNAVADLTVTHFNTANPGTISSPIINSNQYVTRGESSVALDNKYDKLSGRVSFFYNFGRHEINDGNTLEANSLTYTFNSRDRMVGSSVFESIKFFEGNITTFGFDYFHASGHSWNAYFAGENAGTDVDIADKSNNQLAGYVDFRQSLTNWLTLDAALRYDYHSVVDAEWVPTFGMSFALPYDANVKLSVSNGFRYPSIREMYMFPPQNPNLEAERIWNYELSYSQRIENLAFGANIFFINGDNIIQTAFIDGKPKNINSGEIKNSGFELNVSYNLGNGFVFDGNYSFLHMDNPVLASPEQKLHFGAKYVREKFNLSTGIQYIAGLYTNLNTSKEYFTLWNIRASYDILNWLNVWIRGENLLDQEYEINAGFPLPGTTFMFGFNLNF